MEIAYTFIKCCLFALVFYVLSKLYVYIYVPWRIRQRYKGYSNVAMSKKYYPMVGDIELIVQNEKVNKFRRCMFIDLGIQQPNIDFYIFQLGEMTLFSLVSTKACEEFEKLVPDKIDRHDHREYSFLDIARGSFAFLPSHTEWNERRKTILKTIGINCASKYIPLMLETTDNWIRDVKKNESINLTVEIQKITFTIMSKILFGSDIENMESILYQSPYDGTKNHISFMECFFALSKDLFDSYLSVKGRLFPILIKFNLIEPYKSNKVNKETFMKSLDEFLAKSKDSESVYRQIFDSGKFDSRAVVLDMISLLFAGFGTTAQGICSMMYFLQKYPDKMKKLKQALEDEGIKDNNVDAQTADACQYNKNSFLS